MFTMMVGRWVVILVRMVVEVMIYTRAYCGEAFWGSTFAEVS